MVEYQDPANLKPHPRNSDIYGDEPDEGFVDSIAEEGIRQEVRITRESHFTDADATIISGHMRVAAAKENGMKVPVIEVGPYDTEAQEIRALLDYNDVRDKTPTQEFREAEAWREYYESPNVEIDESAVVEACKHVSFGKSTYYQARKIQESAEEGDSTAEEQWGKLERGEEKIGGAYKTWEEAQEDEQKDRDDAVEEHRGWLTDGVFSEEAQVDDPAKAWFEASPARLDALFEQTTLPDSLQSEPRSGVDPHPYVYIEIGDGEVQTRTISTDQSARSTHTFTQEHFEWVRLDRDDPVGMWANVEDILGFLDLSRPAPFGTVILVLCGPEDSDIASELYLTNGMQALGAYPPTCQESSHRKAPDWIQENPNCNFE